MPARRHLLSCALVLPVLLSGSSATSADASKPSPAVRRVVERALSFVRERHPGSVGEPMQSVPPAFSAGYQWRTVSEPPADEAHFSLMLYAREAESPDAARKLLASLHVLISADTAPLDELERHGWIDAGFGPPEGRSGTIVFVRGSMLVHINGNAEASHALAGHLAEFLSTAGDAGA